MVITDFPPMGAHLARRREDERVRALSLPEARERALSLREARARARAFLFTFTGEKGGWEHNCTWRRGGRYILLILNNFLRPHLDAILRPNAGGQCYKGKN